MQERLRHVQQIQASTNGFAAICADGSVVTWGASDSNPVQERLKHVHQIQANLHSFAAILEGGSVVCWGMVAGGDSSAVQDRLTNVREIQASSRAFAARSLSSTLLPFLFWGPLTKTE